jgi:electron transfer flavoprotein alpha subunit
MQRILVLAEHDHGQLKQSTFAAAGFAQQVGAATGGSFDFLVLGSGLTAVAEGLRTAGAAVVLTADAPELQEPLADRYAAVIAATARARGITLVVGAASTFTKDILPRVAALLDAGMLSDVIEVRAEGEALTFRRVMFAGNVIATVQLDGPTRCIAVRSAAFAAPPATAALSPVESVAVDAAALPKFTEFISRETKASARPDATEARIIVSGG